MRNSILILFLGLHSLHTFANPELPEDVLVFVEKRDLCDHFRGEDPYDEERRQFIDENLINLCTGTDKNLSNLKIKYSNNPFVLDKLSTYDIHIEPSQ